MKVKGEIDAHAISFDYYGEKYNNGYSHLLVDQIILYTPFREPLKYPVVAEPYFVLDMSGGALVWYENIDFSLQYLDVISQKLLLVLRIFECICFRLMEVLN